MHKRESQIYILAEGGEVIERRIHTGPSASPPCSAPGPGPGSSSRPRPRAIGHDRPQAEDLRTWALRLAARRGKHVAVVALARRLAGILYALRRDSSVFEPQHVRPPRPAAAATLVRRLREIVWIIAGLAASAAVSSRPVPPARRG